MNDFITQKTYMILAHTRIHTWRFEIYINDYNAELINFRSINERLNTIEHKIELNVLNAMPIKPLLLPFSTIEAIQMFQKDTAVYQDVVSILSNYFSTNNEGLILLQIIYYITIFIFLVGSLFQVFKLYYTERQRPSVYKRCVNNWIGGQIYMVAKKG